LMLDDIMRHLSRVFESEKIQELGSHIILHAIKELGTHAWEWAKEHWTDVLDAISDWFS
jgi:hypothetical protein